MARQEEIIIEVEVNAGESAERLADVKARIDAVKAGTKALKAEQKAINDELRKSGTISNEQANRLKELAAEISKNNADLKELNATEKMYTAQLNTATQNSRKFGDSLVEMSARLAQLKNDYRGLTAAQRESAEGKKMLQSIQSLDKAMKDADATMGDFQRNVGNYQSALMGLNGKVGKVAALFQGSFKNSIAAAGEAFKNFWKMLFTTPVGLISVAIRALVAVFGKLKDAFRTNDEAGTALSAAMAKLTPVVDAINKAFSILAEKLAKVVNGIATAATFIISKMVPSYDAAAAAAARLVKAQDELEDRERQYTVSHAEYQRQIADLQDKAAQRDKYTREQRLGFYDESMRLEKEDLKEKRRIAAQRYNLALEEAAKSRNLQKLTTSEYNKLSDETKNKLAELKAAYIGVDTELSNFSRGQQRRRQSIIKELESEGAAAAAAAKKRAEETAKAMEEAANKALQEMRKLEDLQTKAIEDLDERRRKEIELSYSRQIEDLKKRLEDEKNLNTEAREAINGQIMELENAMWRELAAVDDQQMKEAAERLARLSEEAAKRASEAAKAAAAATAEEQRRIREEYEQTVLGVANAYQEQLNEIYGNASETAKLEAERAERYYESILEMNAETKAALGLSEEEYKNMVLKAEAEMLDARERSAAALQAHASEVASTMKSVTGALSELYGAAAGDSETYEKFKKAMAIVDAVISMASTIAAATSMSTAGDPYTLAIRIAANVAAVTAQFATVIASLKNAAIPSAPKFEKGGIVPGTSYTGDNVWSRLNSGEMVLPRDKQTKLWNMIVEGAPSAGIDYDLIAAAMLKAVSAMPSPILDYREFTAFERRVELSELKRKIL